jgi:NAD(P)-dependent dehydrogenase (short-subunit alcohol dehydrogenase family)
MALELIDLAGKQALITGSSQGRGFANARGLVEHGVSVVLNRRERNKLEATAASLSAAGQHLACKSTNWPRNRTLKIRALWRASGSRRGRRAAVACL